MKKQVKKKQKADETLYCICRQKYEDERFMIQCNVCSDWFHGDCIGISAKQAAAIEEYHCPTCALQNGPLILKKRNFSEAAIAKKDRHGRSGNSRTGTLVFVQELKRRNFPSGEGAVLELSGHELTDHFLNRNGGLNQLILVEKKDGLGLIVPPVSFSVTDLETHVGSMRELDVIDVDRQLGIKMLMREWTEYYLSPERSKIYNLISLEVSNTSLANLVIAPEIVRKIDLINEIWPKDSPFNRPAVEKYCLMGIADCFTDFHIDFGGSSVWYHVLKGEKIFYVIRPTTSNLTLYEQWLKSSVQGSSFFGDQVDKCHRISVKAGQTLIIPSGWIHAVLTTTDTIAFGGNFLHFYNIGLQAQVYEIEKRTSTPGRFKFPNYETCYWYAADYLCNHLVSAREEKRPPHPMLFRAAKEMAIVLKSWVAGKDFPSRQADLIPSEITPAKLVKDLSKQVAFVDKTALAENPVALPQRPQRKNAGANMVVGRKAVNRVKESKSEDESKQENETKEVETETKKGTKKEKVTKNPKRAKPEKEKSAEKLADPIRSPLFNISKPIPSSPTADPASIYDFDEEEDDERQLTLDMTPLRVGNKSRFSAAIAAMEKKIADQKTPPMMKTKEMQDVEEVATLTTPTKTTPTPRKRGRKKGSVKRKLVAETEEPENGSGEENLSPTPAKRKMTSRVGARDDLNEETLEAVTQEATSPKKKKKSKVEKVETTNSVPEAENASEVPDEYVDIEDDISKEKSSKGRKGKSKIRGKQRRAKEALGATTTTTTTTEGNTDADELVVEPASPTPPSKSKSRVLVDLNADENTFDKGAEKKKRKEHVKLGKKEKRDKSEKKTKKKEKDSPMADNEDRVESKEKTDAKDAPATTDESAQGEETKKFENIRSRRERHPAVTLDSQEDIISHIPPLSTTDAIASQSPRNDRQDDGKDPRLRTDSTHSPRMGEEPSSPTYTSKLSSPPCGFSSPHPHHQPPTMLSPTGDQPPLKLRLSINKVFQAKLEGSASSTSMNSSDGEQSGAESESTMGSPPPPAKGAAWAGRRDPLGLSAPDKQGGIFGLASRSFSSPARAAAGLSPIRSNSLEGSADLTTPFRNGLLNSPRLLLGSPSRTNEGLTRSPHAAGMLFPNFISSTPQAKPQRPFRSTWATKEVEEGEVIKAAHEDKDYIYPALEISDFDDGSTGAISKDDTWNPGSKCVPNGPKLERERRDGVRNEAIEKLQEDAKKRLEGQTMNKRPNVKKKKKELGSSLLSMPMHGTSEPLDSDEDTLEAGSSLRIDLEARASTVPRPPTVSLTPTPTNKVEKIRPKKGQATAKQRLGKILKLHRIGH